MASEPIGETGGAAVPQTLFRNKTLRVVTATEFISALGSRMTALAVPWFVLTTTGSPTKMGFTFAVELLPMVVLGIPSALLVHRFGVRRTMLLANAASAVLVALVPLLHHFGLLPYAVLLVIVFMFGAVATPYLTCQRLLVPQVFGNDEVLQTKANALVTASTQITGLAGPPLAGVLIAVMGAPNLLWIDAASFVFALVILDAGLPRSAAGKDRGADAGDGRHHGALAGARFVVGDPLVRRVATVSFVVGAFFPILIASLPVVADDWFHGSARIAGLLLAAWSAGSVIGLLGVLKFAGKFTPARLAALASVGVAAPLWLLLFHLAWPEFALVLVASSLFVYLLNSPMFTLLMVRTPDAIKPQVIAFLMTINMLAGPIGYAVAGPALQSWGVTPVEAIVAAGMTVGALLLLTVSSVEKRACAAAGTADAYEELSGDLPTPSSSA